MKKIIVFTVLLAHCFCYTQTLTRENEISKAATRDKVQNCSDEISKDVAGNERWAALINAQCWNGLRDMYTANAVHVTSVGEVITGTDEVIGKYSATPLQIVKVDSIHRLTADNRKRYDYELLRMETSEGLAYKQFVIWNNSENKREFEFTARSTAGKLPVLQLNKRRDRWMELCNSHNTGALVRELYTGNAIYYNHRPVIIGWDAITKEYGYMNNPNYQLTLTPIIIEMVAENMVFEIGQCSGGYNGKYVLIWEKSADGTWKILMDSNI